MSGRKLRIMAFDPGSVTAGVAFFSLDYHTLDIVDLDTTLYNMRSTYKEKENVDPLTVRIIDLYKRTLRDIAEFKPDYIAIENGFMDHRKPSAFGPLMKSITAIELAVTNIDQTVKIFKFSPKYIKRVTTSFGTAGKSGMMEGIKVIPEINEKVDVCAISEHEIDSLGVGYTLIKHFERYHHLLLL